MRGAHGRVLVRTRANLLSGAAPAGWWTKIHLDRARGRVEPSTPSSTCLQNGGILQAPSRTLTLVEAGLTHTGAPRQRCGKRSRITTIRFVQRFMVAGGIALAVLAALATGAWAEVDANGTYDGKIVCEGFFVGQPFSETYPHNYLQITRTGTTLHVATPDGISIGEIVDDADNIEQAQASLIACVTRAEPSPRGAIAHLKFTRTRATLKVTGKSIVAFGGFVATCTWTFKRTDTADPGVPGCNPPV